MRLNKERINHLASTVVKRLGEHKILEVTGSGESLVRTVETAITEELNAEDRLNAEVREMLKRFESEFAKGQADYQKMFTMVKQKLVRERGIIL